MITARNALDAAGVRFDDDAQLTLRSGTFDADAEAALAWCLREAVTNVIRHSGARSCRVRLIRHAWELSLEVTDDGHGAAPEPDQGQGQGEGEGQAEGEGQGHGQDQGQGPDPEPPRGTGLRGMSERLSAVGGRLSLVPAHPGRGHGFRLTATVPVDRYDP